MSYFDDSMSLAISLAMSLAVAVAGTVPSAVAGAEPSAVAGMIAFKGILQAQVRS
jgi:hypothetical protein